MLVVADSSPIIVLVNIGHTDILPSLFGDVTIPPMVAAELLSARRPQMVRDFISNPPPWLHIKAPAAVEAIPLLDAGEREAISLASEIAADLLLIDERLGREAAKARNLRIAGTIGVLELAALRGLLDLRLAFDLVKQTSFWVSPIFLDERLKDVERRLKKSGDEG